MTQINPPYIFGMLDYEKVRLSGMKICAFFSIEVSSETYIT